MKVLGIAGSLRPGSYNAQLLRAAAALAPDGVEVVELEGLAGVPPFDLDREADGDTPDAVLAFTDAIEQADGVLIATPEYNGSIPGQLKNALDWASVPFPDNVLKNKPVAVVGTSTGMFGAVWAQADLRKVLGLSGARVLDRETPVPLAEMAFTDDGSLADPDIAKSVAETVAGLADLIGERAAAA
jgi:chromate reductase, NAD(P)H dehydrogenase (quinone)